MRRRNIIFVYTVLISLFIQGVFTSDYDNEEEEDSSTIHPVSDPDAQVFPDAEHLNQDFRPPGTTGDPSQDQDLGAIETLSAPPSSEELARIESLAIDDDSLDESKPPKRDQNNNSQNKKEDFQNNIAIGGKTKHHNNNDNYSDNNDNDNDYNESNSKQRSKFGAGYSSRVSSAVDTANEAMEKAKRAANEAKLAIKAAELAKKEADKAVQFGGDGGPDIDEQGLLALDNPLTTNPEIPNFEENEDSYRDAADLGLPNPNPPILFKKKLSLSPSKELPIVNHAQLGESIGEQIRKPLSSSSFKRHQVISDDNDDNNNNRSKYQSRTGDGDGDDDIENGNYKQKQQPQQQQRQQQQQEEEEPQQNNVRDIRHKIMKTVTSPSSRTNLQKKSFSNSDNGEGDEEEFQKHSNVSHKKNVDDKPHHVKLSADSADD